MGTIRIYACGDKNLYPTEQVLIAEAGTSQSARREVHALQGWGKFTEKQEVVCEEILLRGLSEAKKLAEEAVFQIENVVEEHPLKATALLLVAGVVFGLMIGRTIKRR